MGYLRSLADLPRNPPITTLAVIACIASFLTVNANWQGNGVEALRLAGWRDAQAIWDGQWWALVSSTFVHVELWHLAFNIYWLWVLGGRLELELGWKKYSGFIMAAAWMSSAMQLAVSSQTGIGFSGVGYAIFGLMWTSRGSFASFQQILRPRTCQFFILWLFGCLFMTVVGEVDIGNTAHFSGLLFVCLAAPVLTRSRHHQLALAGLGAALAAATATLFYSPWNANWLGYQGYKAQVAEQYERAIGYYDAALERDPHLEWVRLNREAALQQLRAR